MHYTDSGLPQGAFMKFIYFICIVLSTTAYSQGVSQKRLPDESFQNAVERVSRDLQKNVKKLHVKATPLNKKVPIKDLDFSKVTEVKTYKELQNMFQIIRDSRFLKTKDNPDFARRISWLYPDDGCYARAAIAGVRLSSNNIARPLKIFAFGSLEVNTPYALEGSVSWWYHVALVVKYMDSYYVLDPSLNSKKPILFEEWYNMMGHVTALKGVICNAYAYDPFDSCFEAKKDSDRKALEDEQVYLREEWLRIKALGFDPVLFLGKNPPWGDQILWF